MDRNNKNGNSECFSHENLMSYLYGEMKETERARLDVHLVGCRNCTEDFAALSEARFSVYEWQRTEFANLPTPEIVGPWRNPPAAHKQTSSWSWIERIKALVVLHPSGVFAAAAVVMLAIVVWLGFLNFRGATDQSQASLGKNLVRENPSAASPERIAPSPEVAVVEPMGKTDLKPHNPRTVPTSHPFRTDVATIANNVWRGRHRQSLGDGRVKKTLLAVSFKKAPNLSGIEEDEDTTIRLADLFAEVGPENENN